jgi:DNA-binding IscR family transcriptional regulator
MRTQRGAAGGVLLGRPAEQINLRQIVEAVQGPIVVNLCTGPYDGCQRATSCPASSVLTAAQRGLEETLERAILAELSSEVARLAEAREGR